MDETDSFEGQEHKDARLAQGELGMICREC